MEPQKQPLKKVKPVTIVLLAILALLTIIIAFSNGPSKPSIAADRAPTISSRFISARQMKIDIEDLSDGYKFNSPVDLDTMQRLDCVTGSKTIQIFYRNDTVLEASIDNRITDDRNNVLSHLESIKKVVETFGPSVYPWVENSMKASNLKKDWDSYASMNGKFYGVEYYPDVEDDLLRVRMNLTSMN